MLGHEPVIRASAGARNAYEINNFRYTISSQTQNQIDASMVTDEYRVRTTLYSYANTATITVPHGGEGPVIVLDGELPIP